MLAYLRKATTRSADEGASAVEYGLLVAGIAALIVIIVFALGGVIQNAFKDTCDQMVNSGGITGNCNT
jgi:pilus assembly protein Flp/PilA